MKKFFWPAISFLTVCVLLLLFMCTTVVSTFAATKRNYQQTEDPWGYAYYDGYTFASSGCGIMSTVNAVNYLTGNWINPLELANWAHSMGFYTGTYGTERSMWSYLNSSYFTSSYGFKVVGTAYSTVYDSTFRNHIINGGVAVVHVYGHYMSIVGYNQSTGQYLLWDNAAGPVCGYKRPTSTNGDWCTAAQLEGAWNSSYLTIDWYCLISRTGSSTPSAPTAKSYKVLTNVTSGGGKAGFNDDCSTTSASVTQGTTVYFRVTPNSGYVCTKVVVGGTTFSLKNNGVGSQVYTFGMPAGDVRIDVTFAKIAYSLKSEFVGPGTCDFDGKGCVAAKITEGNVVYYDIRPSAGAKISQILVNGVAQSIPSDPTARVVKSFTMPAKDTTVKIVFVSADGITRYTPKTTATGSGTVSFDKTAYEKGEKVSFTVNPSSGYYCANVSLDGKAVLVTNMGGKATYSFTCAAATPTVNVTFKKNNTTTAVASVDSRVKAVVFDAKYYADKYSDLKAAFGYDEAKLWNHFITFGIKEGRRASKIFDVKYYATHNMDLWSAFGPNMIAAFNHFVNSGIKEANRFVSADFNVKVYRETWEDLRAAFGNDYKEYYIHYTQFGIKEGRKCV